MLNPRYPTQGAFTVNLTVANSLCSAVTTSALDLLFSDHMAEVRTLLTRLHLFNDGIFFH